MRLSTLVLAFIVLVSVSVALLAQHSSGSPGSASFGTSSSGGGSHGGSSGGSVSTGSSHGSTGSASHSATGSAGASRASSSFKPSQTKATPEPIKKSGRSFFHPFRKKAPLETAEFVPRRCFKEPCPVCPRGQSRNNAGACVALVNICPYGEYTTGLPCDTQYWFNDCSDLARQLESQKRDMQGLSDLGESLIYQALLRQYENCLAHRGFFGLPWIEDASLLDNP